MAVIKCSNCENEILDSEIVCPYCDCPVSITKGKLSQSSAGTTSGDDSSGTMKIASRKDFEKEKAALMTKLANEEKNLKNSTNTNEGKTVVISKDEFKPGKEHDTDRIPNRNVKSKAEKITISTPGDDRRNVSSRSSARSSSRNKKTKEKGKTLILITTFIGVLLIVYLIYALFSNIQSNMPSLKTKENKSSIVSSDSEVVDKGYKFSSSSTLVITDNDVMEDFDSASDAPWADKAEQIKHITIEDSVEKIGDYAFSNFTALEDVVLGKNVSEIGKEAFYGCESLERVTCRGDSKLRTIGDNAFTNCTSLESFKLGTSIKSIGSGAFKSCSSLEEMEIPSNVKLGDDVFLGCSSDFTIICKKNSNAHDYADEYGLNVEFIESDKDKDDDDDDDDYLDGNYGYDYSSGVSDDDDNTKNGTTSNSGTTSKTKEKTEEKSDKSDKADKTSDTETDKSDDSSKNSDDKTDNSGSSNSGKSQAEIMDEIKDTTSKLKDPNLSADEKASLESQRDSLSAELDTIGQ